MLKIKKNPDKGTYDFVMKEVQVNDGFCPCRIQHTPDTKCPCKDFREQTTEGLCHCGLYQKVEVDDA